MKLEVGMYARIKWGNGLQTISQCKNIVNMGDTQYAKEDFYIHTDHSGEVIYKTMIVKSSFDIIDILEVGDIIRYRIDKVSLATKGYLTGIVDITDEEMLESIKEDKNYHVLQILTKEQFEQMEYRIG